MVKKEYSHLVKPLLIQQDPGRLYPGPRVWMEGKDLEGFQAHFTYGVFKEPCVCHPQEGAVVHPYDECLVFAGTDAPDIRYLGAEVSIELGEEREEHVFETPKAIAIPRGTPHGPVTIRRMRKPIMHWGFGLAPEYKAESLPKKAKTTGLRYGHLIKDLLTQPTANWLGTGLGYQTIVDPDGVLRPAQKGVGPGNADQLIWLFGRDLEGMEANVAFGFYSRCGKWHRLGESHTHPWAEILVQVSLDPDKPDYLGAELEMGMSGERHIYSWPSVSIVHQGFPHLPQITRWCDKPYAFFVLNLSAEHDSSWVTEH